MLGVLLVVELVAGRLVSTDDVDETGSDDEYWLIVELDCVETDVEVSRVELLALVANVLLTVSGILELDSTDEAELIIDVESNEELELLALVTRVLLADSDMLELEGSRDEVETNTDVEYSEELEVAKLDDSVEEASELDVNTWEVELELAKLDDSVEEASEFDVNADDVELELAKLED